MTYSRRKRLESAKAEVKVFRSEFFTKKLLSQAYQIIREMDELLGYDNVITPKLVTYLRKELGTLCLSKSRDTSQEFYGWFNNEYDEDELFALQLDVIELSCQLTLEHAKAIYSRDRYYSAEIVQQAYGLVAEMNARMMEDSFGYQFNSGQLIELNSQFVYEQVINPVLGLLSDKRFAGPNSEFREALEEFKLSKFDDCVADCGNALESTIKVIAAIKGWTDVKDNDPASKLIDAAFRNNLIPAYMQTQFTALRSVIGGAATVRNKEGSHGTGAEPRVTDKHLAAYQLHQTAAAITFMVECAKS